MLGTNLIAETQLLELTVEDTDAQRASDIANEIAFTFISLHNTERQLQNIVALEQDIVAQMANLKELIAYNQLLLDQARTSSDLLAAGESNARQSALSGQQSAYANLLGTYLSIQLTQSQFFDVTVVEPAIAPTKPIRPNIVFNTFLGAFVGLNLSAGLAFLLEYLYRSFETGDDVRQVLSLPTLGTVPRLRGQERSSRLVTSTMPLSPASEAYRALRTNIRFASVDKPLTTLLITSAEPGAGKTTVVANLGVACAQAGLQVVLLDTDLRIPRLHHPFHLNNRAGLTNLLVGDVHNVEECMVRTKIDNLRLITSGPIPPNPSELLGSKRMEAVLAKVKRSADLVILDAPPTLAATDAAVLAQGADGVLLVVYAGKTRHDAARHAVESLLQVGSNMIGVVLNAVPTHRGSYYHYGYYQNGSERQKRRLRLWEGLLEAVQRLLGRRRRAADAN
jgi:capsular exopolysaccharide synthesis family protein